jgi:hypothetical protein
VKGALVSRNSSYGWTASPASAVGLRYVTVTGSPRSSVSSLPPKREIALVCYGLFRPLDHFPCSSLSNPSRSSMAGAGSTRAVGEFRADRPTQVRAVVRLPFLTTSNRGGWHDTASPRCGPLNAPLGPETRYQRQVKGSPTAYRLASGAAYDPLLARHRPGAAGQESPMAPGAFCSTTSAGSPSGAGTIGSPFLPSRRSHDRFQES